MFAEFARRVVPKRFRPIGYLEHLVRERTGGRVAKGPFAGMRYIESSVGSALIPKILGIYERELNDCIEAACKQQFPVIIDIGAAEGYYAVGLARRNPQARVIAFEMEPRGREALYEMMSLNSVSIEIRSKCEVRDLQSSLDGTPTALVVCDTEGYEDILLKPSDIPALTAAHILVEMHDFIVPGITESIIDRFKETHSATRIWQEGRTRKDLPYSSLWTALLPNRYLEWAVDEWRPVKMSWLWLEPRRERYR